MSARRALAAAALALVACREELRFDPENLACGDGCVEGWVCHPERGVCVEAIPVGCGAAGAVCPSEVDTGEACTTPGSFVTCNPLVPGCDGGCRTCGDDGRWSACSQGIVPSCAFGVAEQCNGLDDDCDGDVDEDIAPDALVTECRAKLPNARQVQTWECSAGSCAIAAGGCFTTYYDFDANAANGCEVSCTPDGVEACNDRDDDCDGAKDDVDAVALASECASREPLALNVGAWSCQAGACAITACVPGFVDVDLTVADGCEVSCTPTSPATEVCDGADNDCDGVTDPDDAPGCTVYFRDADGDGFGRPAESRCACAASGEYDVTSAGDCDDDASACGEDCKPGGVEVCDGYDNDCNTATTDGAQDAAIGVACDGGDSDLCADDVTACVAGAPMCTLGGDDRDLCNGDAAEDCDAGTPDGSDEPWFGLSCDGGDVDECAEGVLTCAGGAQQCTDPGGSNPEVCNGIDDDCLDTTADGAAEAWLNQNCDGSDADLCPEGTLQCSGGGQVCTDTSGDTLDLCDVPGADEDCNLATPNGFHEAWYGDACDGSDADLCDEGALVCVAGAPSCDDANDVDLELCDDVDNDCRPATLDGVDEPWLGADCDGADTDFCDEGTYSCVDGLQTCSDTTGSTLDLCDGDTSEDCSVVTADGADEVWFGEACDGPDADACPEGVLTCAGGAQSCTDTTGDSVEAGSCDDGLDNECNGKTDCSDPQCLGSAACAGCVDRDGDGWTSCGPQADCDDRVPQCTNDCGVNSDASEPASARTPDCAEIYCGTDPNDPASFCSVVGADPTDLNVAIFNANNATKRVGILFGQDITIVNSPATITGNDQGVLIRAKLGVTVTVNNPSIGVTLFNLQSSNNEITGLTITNAQRLQRAFSITGNDRAGNRIEDNVVNGFGSAAVSIDGGEPATNDAAADTIIAGNIFRDGTDVEFNGRAAVFVQDAVRTVITGNLLIGNTMDAIQLSDVHDTRIDFNTIANNAQEAIEFFGTAASGTCIRFNNITNNSGAAFELRAAMVSGQEWSCGVTPADLSAWKNNQITNGTDCTDNSFCTDCDCFQNGFLTTGVSPDYVTTTPSSPAYYCLGATAAGLIDAAADVGYDRNGSAAGLFNGTAPEVGGRETGSGGCP